MWCTSASTIAGRRDRAPRASSPRSVSTATGLRYRGAERVLAERPEQVRQMVQVAAVPRDGGTSAVQLGDERRVHGGRRDRHHRDASRLARSDETIERSGDPRRADAERRLAVGGGEVAGAERDELEPGHGDDLLD